MKHCAIIAGLIVALAPASAFGQSSDAPMMPEFPAPTAEHAWLTQLAGEWESTTEHFMAPDQPSTTAKGTETVRSIGGFWIVAENKSSAMGMDYTGILTIGYDPEEEQFVGTWIDSMTSLLWHYKGSLDSARRVLTLYTEGPGMTGEICQFRESIELKSADHKVFTSQMLQEDGEWFTMMRAEYRRVR